ncbi:HD domain-containing protein [Candidatus Uhrbacteria bacterium]|nr:HD domain-containing protein [Candidatus Uhrbacteria bacterium]
MDKNALIEIAKQKISGKDPSHDITHSLRVLANAEMIAKEEGGDLEILIPAALFHDVIQYPRNDPRSPLHAQESADEAVKILNGLPDYPKEKIDTVHYAIRMHNKNNVPDTVEARIIQDADNLEITGAIVVMRMCASAGIMGRALYHPEDPWAEHRECDGLKYTLDYYTGRLLKVESEMHTMTGRKIAQRRTVFLKQFMDELKMELEGK